MTNNKEQFGKRQRAYGLTILTARVPMNKSYWIGPDGRIAKSDYRNALFFDAMPQRLDSLLELWLMLQLASDGANKCIIRGVPDIEVAQTAALDPEDDLVRGQVRPSLIQNCKRQMRLFKEPKGGNNWIMLDFDDLEVPPAVGDPNTEASIEWAIREHLPPEFQCASYIYQFSNSAGLIQPDGSPYKPGLCVHLFFLLEKPLTNAQLKKWLADTPIDKSLLNAVQVHYVANPKLEAGVRCILKERMGRVEKEHETVKRPPEFEPQLEMELVDEP
ncbi:MAG: hypothetical protein FVQ80_14900 [Planctomycetes bacterium]|nr:hypothetical protein [Planctomycetota bacterium]